MRFIKLSAIVFTVALASTACNLLETRETARPESYEAETLRAEAVSEADSRYARENLDLRAVGALLEKADNAEEFEYLLNNEGVNNLDLNRDGYADYISVSEFEDRFDDERGLSLFSRFGPDLVQQIATIIFDREGFRDRRGARILLTGDEQLYGDDYYYETNWRDRSLSIVEWLFDDNRGEYYRSPYYYGNYPDDYAAYETIETPVYRTRIEQVYYTDAAPVFVRTSNPAVVSDIKIKSPYEGRTVGKNFPKPGKLSKEEKEFIKNNRVETAPPEFVPVKKGKIKDVPPGFENRRERGNPNDFEKPRKADNAKFEKREKPNKEWKESVKPPKIDRPAFNPPMAKPNKAEKQNMKPPKADKPQGGNGNGKGNGKGNGGGNKGGGGGGKGGGKKN